MKKVTERIELAKKLSSKITAKFSKNDSSLEEGICPDLFSEIDMILSMSLNERLDMGIEINGLTGMIDKELRIKHFNNKVMK